MSQTPTIRSFFEEDHDRLDHLFVSARAQRESDPAQARGAFAQFRAGLERHIVWEEQVLFPIWEQKTGMAQVGPTAVMRAEHRQIHHLLDRVQATLSEQTAESAAVAQALGDLLASHNMKEERVLYPAIDQAVSAEERAAVFRAIHETSPGREGCA